MAADSLGGSVNVISKSAFERSRAQLRVGLNFSGNSENLYLGKRPDSNADNYKHMIVPGGTIDLTLPIGKDFGLVLTAMRSTNVNSAVGAFGLPTLSDGVPLSYGPDFVAGATGRGTVNISGSGQIVLPKNAGRHRELPLRQRRVDDRGLAQWFDFAPGAPRSRERPLHGSQHRFGADGFLYVEGRTTRDVSLSYKLTRRFSLDATAINPTNAGTRTLNYGSATPAYARQNQIADWGTSLGVGINDTF